MTDRHHAALVELARMAPLIELSRLAPPRAEPRPLFSPGVARRFALVGLLAAVWFLGGATAAVLFVL